LGPEFSSATRLPPMSSKCEASFTVVRNRNVALIVFSKLAMVLWSVEPPNT
jgi:hypothetical protein